MEKGFFYFSRITENFASAEATRGLSARPLDPFRRARIENHIVFKLNHTPRRYPAGRCPLCFFGGLTPNAEPALANALGLIERLIGAVI